MTLYPSAALWTPGSFFAALLVTFCGRVRHQSLTVILSHTIELSGWSPPRSSGLLDDLVCLHLSKVPSDFVNVSRDLRNMQVYHAVRMDLVIGAVLRDYHMLQVHLSVLLSLHHKLQLTLSSGVKACGPATFRGFLNPVAALA